MPSGLLALVVGSLLGRPVSEKRLDDFYLLIKTPVGEEGRLK